MSGARVQTASHWGVYDVETGADGAILNTIPSAVDPQPSGYVGGLPEIVRSTLRIDQPYVRAGYLRNRSGRDQRGGDTFVAVSWDEALGLVADELLRVKTEFGNDAIYAGTSGWASAGRLHHAPSVVRRFLGLHGGYVDKRGNHSFGAAMGITPYVLGRGDVSNLVVRWPSVVEATRLVVTFGGAHLKNSQVEHGGAVLHEAGDWLGRAARAGIRFVNISPSRQNLPADIDAEWLPLRPNTDTALMLGLAHTLATDRLHDRAFLARYCEGYEAFEAYLLGSSSGVPRDATWAASVTGIPADTIVALARRMAAQRTLVTTSWSVQRADHGEQPVWMTIALAAMLGQIGLPGGGFTFGIGATNGIASERPRDMPIPSLPVGQNPVRAYVPVGRTADMLLHPGTELEHNGERLTLPDIKLIYSVGGNPFHHNTNLNRFVQGWQQPDTVIVHEHWWNPAAKHADIVLPATTTLERNDILANDKQRFWVAMHKVIDPVGKARNDFDIFADLATRLGFGARFTEGRDEMGWLRFIYDAARTQALQRGYAPPEFDAFWESGIVEFPQPASPSVLLSEFRADPTASPLRTPSGKIEIFSQRIAAFGYDDCPPHPAWIEPTEWLGSDLARRFPLHLLSNQPRTRLHSQLDPALVSRESKIAGREPIALHPADAAARGVAAGDVVRVFNDRGAFLAGVVLTDDLLPGVVQIATGAWYDPLAGGVPGTLEKHGNPNVVTLDKGTSRLAQAPIAQTVLVEIERYRDAPPAVTAFERPLIASRG